MQLFGLKSFVIAGSTTVSIPLQLSLKEGVFNKSLRGEYEHKFKIKLTQLYKTTIGFQSVAILNVTNGSIICDYDVICKGNVDLTKIATTTANIGKAHQSLNFTFCQNCSVVVNSTAIAQAFHTANQKRTTSACSNCVDGERCVIDLQKGTVQCIDPCRAMDNGGCKNDGECYFDRRANLTKCRCKSDGDRFVYSGEHCEIPVEKLTLSSTYIAALAGGSGGGVIVIMSVVIICLIVRKRKQKDVDKNGRQGTGGVRLSLDKYPRTREDTLTVEGKEHKIITNSLGNEVYMYQPNPSDIRRHPSSRVSSSESDYNRSRTASVYDYIDTESRYEIQRPTLRPNINRM
ncbi:IMPG2-like protein [Mya arenaria]|uniref:IMPG2-like protein n=1 Tax=Mya arenaria TaxID=6604 RepID=A0ABY7EQV9_MYAAR|nr:IMPG2-like protein [Mya arenaria]